VFGWPTAFSLLQPARPSLLVLLVPFPEEPRKHAIEGSLSRACSWGSRRPLGSRGYSEDPVRPAEGQLEHYWELEYVRTRFAEFKHRIQELEDADDQEITRIQEAVEVSWKDLIHAVDTLLAALP
jgi:hypothetical protein